jgi:Protein of unknown function (DUF4236)
MSWRFRQSFTVVPGLRLNLSKRGLSASIGGAPLTMNIGPHGVTNTLSIPGTGLSCRSHVSPTATHLPPNGTPNVSPSIPSYYPPPAPHQFINPSPIEEVHSAGTELLTSESLKNLKHLIQTAFAEREDIGRELETAQADKGRATIKYKSWINQVLFQRFLKKTFSKRKVDFETETAKVRELEEQLRLTTISTHIEVENEQANFYYRLKDDFSAMCECAAIWDIKTHQATDRFHERTTANLRVERQLVKFELGACDLIQWEQTVPHIQNSKNGDFYLYPGFILYRAAKEAFSVIEYHDVKGTAVMMSFHEEEGVPSDARVIGQTWAKANKDGNRDRRFAENHQIPIAQYGQVTFKSTNGLWEEFQFSNPERLLNFLGAFNGFAASFAPIAR